MRIFGLCRIDFVAVGRCAGGIRQGLAYGISLGLGFVLIAAPWSYRLEQRFGIPLFPLMNNVFRSPELSTVPARALRFVPETVTDALWRPFDMIDPVTMVHEELRAPAGSAVHVSTVDTDWRLVLSLAVVQRSAASSSQPVASTDAVSSATLGALGCGLALDWLAWLSGSGNSRYFLPMSSVAAVVIVALLFRLFATQPKARNYVLAGILGLQGVQLWMGAEYRWNQAPWDDHWINIEVPAKLASEPNLFLTMGTPTNSFLAPYLAPGSRQLRLIFQAFTL